MNPAAITRRDFLRGATSAALAVAWGGGSPTPVQGEAGAEVVLVRHGEVVGKDRKIQAAILQTMLDEAVKTLLGTGSALQGWGRLFQQRDVVGIKSNSWARLPTPRELEEAILRRLREVGIQEQNLSVDDRGVLQNPVFHKATALINVRPLRTHHWSGMGSCLKNYIMFVPDPSSYHGEGCSNLGKIWTYPIVKGKTRLNILCALTPQFYGRGAHFFDRRYVWPYGGLLVGRDPVAVDAVGAEILKRKRISFFGEDRSLDVPPMHITVADHQYHLGTSDLSRIRLVKLGWEEGAML
jgi:hypothetical protein